MRAALVTIYLTSEFFNTNLLVINRGMSGKRWASHMRRGAFVAVHLRELGDNMSCNAEVQPVFSVPFWW